MTHILNHAVLHTESSSTLSLSPRIKAHYSEAIHQVSSAILAMFVAGKSCDRHAVSQIMCEAFGGADAAGAWQWKNAHEAVKVALVRFVRQYSLKLLIIFYSLICSFLVFTN